MIWSPYAIRRATYAFNKFRDRTFQDRMVCALNEAARIHGLKGSNDEVINELNMKIQDYEKEIISLEDKIKKTRESCKEEINKQRKRARKFQKRAAPLGRLFGELRTDLCGANSSEYMETKEKKIKHIMTILNTRVIEYLEQSKIEEDEDEDDMHHGP